MKDAPGFSVLRESAAHYAADSHAEIVSVSAPDGLTANESSAQTDGCGGETALAHALWRMVAAVKPLWRPTWDEFPRFTGTLRVLRLPPARPDPLRFLA